MNTIRGVNCEGLPSRRKRHGRESSFPAPSTEPGLGPSSSLVAEEIFGQLCDRSLASIYREYP